MKIIKRISSIVIVLVIILLLFRGSIYRKLINYKSVIIRKEYVVKSSKLVNCIELNSENKQNLNIDEIIKLALLITSQELNFTADKNYNDPNKLIISKTAHCVGYASFFSSTCNYIIKKNKLDTVWTAKPYKGEIYFLGVNVHKYLNSPFFKNHDFVIIENKLSGEILAVDPTINDYFYINFVTIKKSKIE